MALTDNGYEQSNFDTIHDQQVAAMKDKFGSDIDTSAGSFLGRLIDYQTQIQVNNDSANHDNYDAGFIDTATGVQLDRLASNHGLQRNQAQYAEASLSFQGQAGYKIDENTEFVTDNGDSFYTSQDVQLDSNGNGNVNAISQGASNSANVPAHSIINQANPVSEIKSVDNNAPAQGGADLENDYYLRNRLKQNEKAAESPTRDGINTALLNISGVIGVNVQDNYSNQTDDNGNPAHSLHVFVSGGNPDEIGDKLARNSVGATVGDIKRDVNIDGSIKTVRFDMAQTTPIYFNLSLSTGDGYDKDSVIQSVIDYISDFEMGDTIILTKLYSYLYQLSGIKEVTNVQISTDGKSFSNSNVDLQKYQIAQTDESKIGVNENG